MNYIEILHGGYESYVAFALKTVDLFQTRVPL